MERQTITGSLSTSGRLSGALSVGGGTTDYNVLGNKPKINNVELVGNKNSADLGLEPTINYPYDQTKYYNGMGQWTTPPSGVTSYNDLTDKPSINGVTLSGNKTADDLELSSKGQFNSLSGVIVSFNDGQDLPLAKCIAEITPKQAGSGTPSPSNVRAISGYTAVRINVTNKNHLRMTLNGLKNRNTGGTWNGNVYTLNNLTFTVNVDTNGVVNSITVNGTNANTYTRFTLDLPILISGQTYTLSGAPSGYSGTNATIYLGNSPATIGIQNPAISGGVPVTFTPTQTGEPTANINVNAGVTVNSAVFYPQIELGSEATTYEAYAGSTTTTPLGQSVYGGGLNVLTGELVVTYGYIASYNGETLTGEWLSDRDEYTSGGTPTTGAEVVYELATPQTVQLTPQEVNSLLGQNNISADTGDISITYINNVNDPIIKYILNNM